MLDHRLPLRLAVTDPLVFHQDRPALFGCLPDPFDVGYLFVGGNALVLGQGNNLPVVGAKSLGHGFPAKATVEEKLRMRLLG